MVNYHYFAIILAKICYWKNYMLLKNVKVYVSDTNI